MIFLERLKTGDEEAGLIKGINVIWIKISGLQLMLQDIYHMLEIKEKSNSYELDFS